MVREPHHRPGPAPLLTCCLAAACAGSTAGTKSHVFYRPQPVGSEAAFDPASSSLQYVLDGAQMRNADLDDYEEDVELVWRHLGSPFHVIEANGGYREFVNAEILPIDFDNLEDCKSILPNVALHALGGGVLYRKNAEWLEAHGFPAPFFTSAVLAMTTEVLAEATEKPATVPTDEIADFWIWRPVGIWLFSDEDRSRWVDRTLHPVVWPYMAMWDVDDSEFRNVGINYALRPDWLGDRDTRLFAHLGLTNLFGLSHDLGHGHSLSWGLGAATREVNPVDLRASGGLFLDHRDSLLASLVIGSTEEFAVRANLYPGVLFGAEAGIGVFLAVTDHGDPAAGVYWRFPAGVSL
jgi:hypothetical protein